MTDAPFPEGDDALSRTLVFDHPSENRTDQMLVTLYADGSVEVAQRMTSGSTWGPPWSLKECETW